MSRLYCHVVVMIFGVILSVSGSVVHNSILVWFHINNTAAIITVAVAIIYLIIFN